MTRRAARIIFMGTPEFAAPSLAALLDAGHQVLAVVTQPDKPRGRGLASAPSPVKALALGCGLAVLEPRSLRDDAFTTALSLYSPDMIAVVAYGKILPKAILGLPPMGCVNLHASLLPRHRGAAPINWAIINGDKETGVCTMLMDEGMDTGGVLLCEREPIGREDTAGELYQRLSVRGAALLARTAGLLIEGGLKPTAQDSSMATYAPMLKKEDGRIDWAQSAAQVHDRVRGVCPWPGAQTSWKGLLKIHRGKVAEGVRPPEGSAPGTVLDCSGEGILVACGSGAYEITELQPENKRRMGAADFIKGYRLGAGERLA